MKRSLPFLQSGFLTLFLTLFVGMSLGFGQDISMSLVLSPPYSGQVSHYTDLSEQDQLFLTLGNPGAANLEIYFHVSILRNNGPFVASKPSYRPSTPIQLDAGAMESFGGSRLNDLQLNLSANDVVGLSSDQINQILLDDAMPEGEYQICFRAFNFATRSPLTINGEEEYCSFSFQIFQGGYAELITPEEDQIVGEDGSTDLLISWFYNGTDDGSYDIRYRIKLIDLTDQQVEPGNVTMAMLDPGVASFFESDEEGVSTQTYTYGFDPTNPALIDGHQYAVRVTAFEYNDLLFFPQGGLSEVRSFQVSIDSSALQCSNPDYRIVADFPLASDTIPFNFTPVVARVRPLCDDYRRFNFTLDVAGGPGYNRTDHNTWTRGPVAYLSNLLGETVTRERASYFVFNLQAEQTSAMGDLQPGVAYTWDVESSMVQQGNGTHSGNTEAQTWTHGMPRPQNVSPAHESRQDSGQVQLRWTTGDVPDRLLPTRLDLIRAASSTVLGRISLGAVHEACVVQLCRKPDFAPTTVIAHHKVEVDLPDPGAAPEAIAAALYHDVDYTITASDTGKYYWRALWLKNPDQTIATEGDLAAEDVYHVGPTWMFYIGKDTIPTTPDTPRTTTTQEDLACESNCLIALPAATNPRPTLATGDIFMLGKFSVLVTSTISSTSPFSGAGEVAIPFANGLRIKVNFTDVRVNGLGEAYTGEALAVQDQHPFTPGQQISYGGHVVPVLPPSQLAELNDFLAGEERLVSGLTGLRSIGLPIGLDRTFGGQHITLAVMRMAFTATTAKLDIVCAFPIPDFDSYVGLGIGDYCFNPDGLGTDGRLYLADDITFNPDDDVVFSVSGGLSGADSTTITYAQFDCSGFTCLQLRGELAFDTSLIKPLPDVAGAGERVTASLSAKLCWQSGYDFIARAHLDGFVVNDADKYAFQPSDIWVDYSDQENPVDMRVPAGYEWAGPSARERNTWKGVYIPNLSMAIPREIVDDPAYHVAVDHFIIDFDPGAVTVRALAVNLVAEGDANIDGWGITVDSVYLFLIQSDSLEAGLKGRLEMPLTDEGEHLFYRAALNSSGLELAVTVDTNDLLRVPLMAAELKLAKNSYLKIKLGDEEGIEANLSGMINIADTTARRLAATGLSPSMSFRGIRFEDIHMDTRQEVYSRGVWSLASPPKYLAGFPIQIDSIGLDLSDLAAPSFYIKPRIVLMGDDGGVAAAALLNFNARSETLPGGRKKWKLDDVALSEIDLDATVSGIKLKGSIAWQQTGTVEEIAGAIDVTIPMGIRGQMSCTFGTYRANPTALFGTANYFSYWQVDGLVQFDPGLTLMPGLALYGLGGGVYSHMRMVGDKPPVVSAVRAAPSSAGTDDLDAPVTNAVLASGARYERHFATSLGLAFTAIIGTSPEPNAFNADVTLRGVFAQAGGLTQLTLQGDAYVMTGLDERASENKMVWADFNVTYQPPLRELHGSFNVFLDVKGILVGSDPGKRMVNMTFHVDPAQWYVYLGTHTSRGGIKLMLGDKELAGLTEYMMIGHGVPTDLPPIEHARLRNLLYAGTGNSNDGSGNSVDSDEAAIRAARAAGFSAETGNIESGKGFAFGTAFSTSGSITPTPFYFDFELALGVDALVSKTAAGLTCAETGLAPGANGWRAKGQVYAGFWGELGISVKIIRRFKVAILNLAAGFQLTAAIPNPNYFGGTAVVEYSVLGGRVSGRKSLAFDFGEKCTLVSEDPLANIRIIQSIGPMGDQSVYAPAAASFNLPINEMIVLPRSIPDDGPPTFYRFEPFIDAFTISGPGGAVVCQPVKIRNNGYSALLEPFAVLEPNGNHRANLVIRFQDHSDSATTLLYLNPDTGQPYTEDSSSTFRTGPRPTVIPPDQVKYSYPMAAQRHYLPAALDHKGLVALTRSHAYLMYTEQNGQRYRYAIRYTPLGGGDTLTVAQTDLSRLTIPLQLPATLAASQVYRAQILRIRIQDLSTQVGGGMNLLTLTPNSTLPPQQQLIANANLFTYVQTNYGGTDYQVIRRTANVSAAAFSQPPREAELYSWTFRTSAYGNLAQKLADLDLSAVQPHNGMGLYGAYVNGQIPEHFDRVDLHGVYYQGEQVLPPLLSFHPSFANDYYGYQLTRFYSTLSQLRQTTSVRWRTRVANSNIDITIPLGAWANVTAANWLMEASEQDFTLNPSATTIDELLSSAEMGMGRLGGAVVTNGGNLTFNPQGLGTMGGPGSGPTGGGGGRGSFGGQTYPGGPGTSAPSNFGLVFSGPERVREDLEQMRSKINDLYSRYTGFRMSGSQVVSYNRFNYQNQPVGSFVEICLRDAIRLDKPEAYVLMERIRLRPWQEVAAFHSNSPDFPLNTRSSRSYSGTYTVRFNYQVPTLGMDTFTKNFTLHAPPTVLVNGN